MVLGQQYFGVIPRLESAIYSPVPQLFLSRRVSVSKVTAAGSSIFFNLLMIAADV
jgi:hypothetical protein